MSSDIDILLEEQLVGGSFEADLSVDPQGLTEDHPFHWNNIQANPKGNHGVYESRGNWYKTMKYEVLHSGGFLRLFTLRGRMYWNGQNESEHTTPDWKLHFSCDLDHIGSAWNSLVALFVDMKCEIGMKVTTLNENQWSQGQRGREVTVYIYRYHVSYKDYMQGVVPEHDHDLYLGPELHDVYTAPFWYNFITLAECRLSAVGVQSRGVAVGDLELPGCTFASLRNEAYIRVPIVEPLVAFNNDNGEEKKDEDLEQVMLPIQAATNTPTVLIAPVMKLVYPPNDCGWNAARHINPFLDVIFFLRAREKIMNGNVTS